MSRVVTRAEHHRRMDSVMEPHLGYCRECRQTWPCLYEQGRADERAKAASKRLVQVIFHAPDDGAKPFVLQRITDVSGVSGTGVVAHGVEFPDGTVALRWVGGNPTSVVFHDNGMASVEAIHGHGGNTRIVWTYEDLGPRAAEMDEVQALGYSQGQRDAHSEFLTPAALEACGPEDPRYAKGQRDEREAAAQRVEALRNHWNGQHDVVQLNAAVSAVRGDSDE